ASIRSCYQMIPILFLSLLAIVSNQHSSLLHPHLWECLNRDVSMFVQFDYP
ncbi:hypothetical protein O181_088732, partial [Austropuccinia psidii MF-1]|nr:hypothetical protein [Austropuccinia psidii MF-1]